MHFAVLVAALLLAACAGQAHQWPEAQVSGADLVSGERLPFHIPSPADERHWLAPDEAMLAFAAAPAGRPHPAAFRRLVEDLLVGADRGFEYDPSATLTARDTFARQRANCLGLAAMVVSVGRAAGFNVQFQRVQLPPRWELREDIAVLNLHVNAIAVFPRGMNVEVEWSGSQDLPPTRRDLISDTEALAEYHNNLGSEAMLAGDLPTAFAAMRRALELAPHVAHLWSNLAVLYRGLGDDAAAEAAWLRALERDSALMPALGGLHRLYRQRNEIELAAQVERRVDKYRRQNPFYHYLLAREALEQGDFRAARESIARALARHQDPRFHELVAELRSQGE